MAIGDAFHLYINFSSQLGCFHVIYIVPWHLFYVRPFFTNAFWHGFCSLFSSIRGCWRIFNSSYCHFLWILIVLPCLLPLFGLLFWLIVNFKIPALIFFTLLSYFEITTLSCCSPWSVIDVASSFVSCSKICFFSELSIIFMCCTHTSEHGAVSGHFRQFAR